jgi:hypothetical protein
LGSSAELRIFVPRCLAQRLQRRLADALEGLRGCFSFLEALAAQLFDKLLNLAIIGAN